MSRVAKAPVSVPKGIEVDLQAAQLTLKKGKASLTQALHPTVDVKFEDNVFKFTVHKDTISAWAMAGTTRALVNNMVQGLDKGFERKLQLVGVGYRAQVQGNNLNLTLGFSHPVNFPIPDGISIETPTQTEIVIKGADKQVVGQVAANIRKYRPPEPYKGKGIKYAGEVISLKETKKKK